MPACHVVFYQEKDGAAPALDWLKELRSTDAKAFTKCRAALARLALLGHELRRPEADYLRDDIHELRIDGARLIIGCFIFSMAAPFPSWPTV
jgi:hypothetical protein